MAKTIAETIAEQLGDNGMTWQDTSGNTLDRLAAEAGGELHRHPTRNDVCRWTFPDGSAITEAGEAWDFGFPACWCWVGAPYEAHPAPAGDCELASRDPWDIDGEG